MKHLGPAPLVLPSGAARRGVETRARRLGAMLVAFALAPLGACGSTSAPESPPLDFSGPPAQTVPSASGAVNVAIRWSPTTPVKGYDAAELTFSDSAGNPVDGLTVSVVPWMPAHCHGTSIQPVLMPSGPGVQIASPLYLFMSGQWQLLTTISGPVDDTATPTVEIP